MTKSILRYKRNKASFTAAYPEYQLGITKLMEVIRASRQERNLVKSRKGKASFR